MAPPRNWTDYDHERKSWYYYDETINEYIYANGIQVPGPSRQSQGGAAVSPNQSASLASLSQNAQTSGTGYSFDLGTAFSDMSLSGRVTGADVSVGNQGRTTSTVPTLQQPSTWSTNYGTQTSTLYNDTTSHSFGFVNLDTYGTQDSFASGGAAPELSDKDKLSKVSREVVLDPDDRNTPPDFPLSGQGVRPHRILYGSRGDREKLDPSFKILYPGKLHFKRGFVFRVLWPELAGDSNQNITVPSMCRWKGENIFCKIRWFVVVREGHNSSTCLSIQTYGGRGVPAQKPKDHHAIMYTGTREPRPTATETRIGERGLGPSIRVDPIEPYDTMDPMSRVNFVKVYTVEHNVKVERFGYVAKDEEWKLITQFNSHWGISDTDAMPPPSQQGYPSNTSQLSSSSFAYPARAESSHTATSHSSAYPYSMQPIAEHASPYQQTMSNQYGTSSQNPAPSHYGSSSYYPILTPYSGQGQHNPTNPYATPIQNSSPHVYSTTSQHGTSATQSESYASQSPRSDQGYQGHYPSQRGINMPSNSTYDDPAIEEELYDTNSQRSHRRRADSHVSDRSAGKKRRD